MPVVRLPFRERKVRLPFPEKIPVKYSLIFAVLLGTVQLIQGTDPLFALCFFLFVVVSTVAFNLAGGFNRPSGGYVFFFATEAVILGVFWKAVIGEAADSNLMQPILYMEAALGGMVGMCLAVLVSRQLRKKTPILPSLSNEKLWQATIGCLITGLALTAVLVFVPYGSGSVLSSLSQLNGFLPLAMIIGVIYEIRQSGGTRTVNAPVLISGFTIFFLGITSYSKQGIFTPLFCWALAAASQRFKFSAYKIITVLGMLLFAGYYLVPFSQFGRNYKVSPSTKAETGVDISRLDAFVQNVEISFTFLTQLNSVRERYKQTEAPARIEGIPAYYNTPQGLFDRLQMVDMDDALINVTEERGAFGLSPIYISFENWVPHFLWPGKPSIKIGNFYAHEIGLLSPDDVTTGIAFSPIGEGFHIARWTGVLLILPALWVALFTLYDSLCGDIRFSPWGLLALVIFGHSAPESGLSGIIYLLWFQAISVSFAVLAAIYVMPILGYIATGSRDARQGNAVVRSLPRRLPPVPRS
jgi:hypothetical protein